MITGISKKITRFNTVKHYLGRETLSQSLSGLAYDLGYSDGSHLSAEFKRFSNISSGEYVKKKGSSRILFFNCIVLLLGTNLCKLTFYFRINSLNQINGENAI